MSEKVEINKPIAHVVRPSVLFDLLLLGVEHKRPMFIWGSPGVGKSDLVAQVGKHTGRPIIDIRLLLCESTDLKGIPYYNPVSNTMRWAPPNELPKPGDVSLDNAIIFFDEMNAAPQAVMGAALQLILNRKIGEYTLPPDVVMFAAGNLDTDRGITNRMPTPLANRFLHYQLVLNHTDWTDWAIKNNIHNEVIGYLQEHRQHLYSFNPKDPNKAFATGRTWEFFSGFLHNKNLSDDMVGHLVAGCVGDGIASSYMAHRAHSHNLPKPEHVLDGSATKLETDEISAIWSLSISVCHLLKERYTTTDQAEFHSNVDNMMKFALKNYSPEMVILTMRTLVKTYKVKFSPKYVPNFVPFHDKFGKYMTDNKN